MRIPHPLRAVRVPGCLRRRAVVAAVVGAVAALAPASAASAHGGGGSDATNYLITVTEPGDGGLEWKVRGGDALLELTNRTGERVDIRGYEGEPYLRFMPDGSVMENQRSPTTYLNQERFGDVDVPPEADGEATPEWKEVAGNGRHSWHDHRAHWMSPTPPTAVAADPDREHLILSWTVPIEIGEGASPRRTEAAGTLRWVPPVKWWPPLLALGGAFAIITAAAVLLSRPRGDRWPVVTRTAVVALLAVVAANIVRTIDDLRAMPASPAEQLVVIIVNTLGLAGIVAFSIVGWRGAPPRGFLGVGAAGMLTMLLFAADANDQLSASQLATTMPDWVRRGTVAASYTILIPAFIATWLGARQWSRHLRDQAHADATPESAGGEHA